LYHFTALVYYMAKMYYAKDLACPKYNPQNETYPLHKTKRIFSQNETYQKIRKF
jgi:hypothetical protein